MVVNDQERRSKRLDLVEQVDLLNDEVKTLAINLAVHMAKVKSEGQSPELVKMEPQFLRLVNGTVRAVKDLAIILDAAKNRETMAYDPPSDGQTDDRIEFGLRSILAQCSEIMQALSGAKDLTA